MKAGRELDALIAEKVMGYRVVPIDPHEYQTAEYQKRIATGRGFIYYPPGKEGGSFTPPPFSTDIAAAWEVVNHFIGEDGREQDFFIECWSDGEWYVAFHNVLDKPRAPEGNCDGKETGHPSAPLAICRAALQSLEME